MLQKFNINVRNERKLNQLIERAERAEKEQDQKGLLWTFGSVVTVIFTAFLPEFFKESGWQTSIDIAIKSILVYAMVLFFVGVLRDLFFLQKSVFWILLSAMLKISSYFPIKPAR
ncbi:hypothetical protein ACRQ5I_05930 [Pseudoramibacter alactolyticus]|uniref:hypothetical protein n=1 Tax=Pseudoramibacter alactolyticus TaxID=113287 RepID=UPI003D7F1E04